MTKLRHGLHEKQLRLLSKTKMPRPPLEKHLVDAARGALIYIPFTKVWSGRVWSSGRIPFIPALGKGTPDLVGVTLGQMWAEEFKRDIDEKERATQLRWRTEAELAGVRVKTEIIDIAEALEFVRAIYAERRR